MSRLQIIVTGQVQGVGLRPHVFHTAQQLGLTGFVKNNFSGVYIEVQGDIASQFVAKLNATLPPLAKVNNIQIKSIHIKKNEKSFEIIKSEAVEGQSVIPPDTCICSDCLNELFDPASRYYRYPFLNCTQCGPRLTITLQLPYDRCQTSMRQFPLCDACCIDYSAPENRRYHAQPTACAKCGPQLSLSINEIAKMILRGEIVALKGLGGYQLICDARNEAAIAILRAKKNRQAKPFALMAANLASINTIAEVNDHEEKLLTSPARPIVLLKKKDKTLSASIAPGLSHIGMMLPSTPLHYLLLNEFSGQRSGTEWMDEIQPMILIVTSANSGGEPLVIKDHLAQSELQEITDNIVSYNREILTRVDDSVARVINNIPVYIRRSRGYALTPIQLPYSIPPTIAIGGQLKNTICITRGNEAFVSQHIGNLNNQSTIAFFHESLNYLLKFLNVIPERIAHDSHPDFYTSRFAESYGMLTFPIQHHHAHLTSVAAEHHIQQPVLGLALDGYGYGINGESWGGELLLLENTTFKHLGNLSPLPQPGGDIATREPWRMAASVLHLLGRGEEIGKRFADQPQSHLLDQLLEKRINCPMTSSCGRLFDAVSALVGLQTLSQYEGQTAMQLESLVTNPQIIPNGWRINERYFDIMPTLDFLLNINDPVLGANLFHGTLIAGLAAWVKGIARETGIDTVLLSGGCFLNKVLTEGLIQSFCESGIKPLLPRALPPNDGGISLGQAWIAGRS
ncbi:MAG: carbamoyltransferase HypF [Gammaproteobacteria bacterium RIFCSPHIGHO2_12_FULL_42_10]|nr:MAG: carbamoyltransferase HypF [Gammaproteobacteria bacterium RIFCSPHIGHO2_12_FULL_42_10]